MVCPVLIIAETVFIQNIRIVICKGITASDEELEENNRSRSARLRVIEKIKD